MSVKKIWMMSLTMGVLVAVLAYIVLFYKPAAKTSTEEQAKQEEKVDTVSAAEKEKVEEPGEIPKREMTNPIVEVSKGMRAISLFVELAPGVSGYVQPNSIVDVVAYETYKDEKTEKEFKSAVLVLEKVKVLTSGKSSDNLEEAFGYDTVTLEVTPEDGVMLSLATRDKDGFYLMLRNEEDEEVGKQGYKETREIFKDKKEEEEKK